MGIKIVAAAVLSIVLWMLFRFAMELRWAKIEREAEHRAQEEEGRRVIAELPLPSGAVELLVEDACALRWGGTIVAKAEIRGARLMMNGHILGECVRARATLPAGAPPDPCDGGERWDVAIYLAPGFSQVIHCGNLREGVSREIAGRAYAAAKAAVQIAVEGSGDSDPLV